MCVLLFIYLIGYLVWIINMIAIIVITIPGSFNGFVQDCSNSTAKALELLESCTKPAI